MVGLVDICLNLNPTNLDTFLLIIESKGVVDLESYISTFFVL